MIDAIQAFIKRFDSSSFDQRYLEWGELIHHAAVYTDYLIIVPDAQDDDREELVQALSHLHGNSFDMASLSGNEDTSWEDILLCINEALGSDQTFEDTLQLAEHCVAVAEHRYAAAGNLLIAIDCSEQISDEVLNQIAHFALLGQRYIVFVLLGMPGFSDVIREGPAHAMKQYLPDPSQDTARIVHHDRLADRIRQWFDEVLLRHLQQVSWLKGIWQPITEGGFPLPHTIAATIAIVAVVVGALFWPAEKEEAFQETVLDDKPAPVLVGADGLISREDGESLVPSVDEAYELPRHSDDVSRPLAQKAPAPELSVQTPEIPAMPVPSSVAVEPLAVSEHYTIQLIGVRDQAAALAYMKQWGHQLSQPIGFLETRLKDKPWYVVVAGRFDEKQVAKDAIQTLPLELKNSKPWIRLATTPVSWLK